MSFIGALNFFTNFIEKLHINVKPLYDLLHENTSWNWTPEHVNLQYPIQNTHFLLPLMLP